MQADGIATILDAVVLVDDIVGVARGTIVLHKEGIICPILIVYADEGNWCNLLYFHLHEESSAIAPPVFCFG